MFFINLRLRPTHLATYLYYLSNSLVTDLFVITFYHQQQCSNDFLVPYGRAKKKLSFLKKLKRGNMPTYFFPLVIINIKL